MNEIYNLECNDCGGIIELSTNSSGLQSVIDACVEALTYLHKQGKYITADLFKPKYQKLVKATNDFLNKSITDNNVTDLMRDAFEKDVWIFSHLKTHAQLLEAGSLLLDENGHIKSFDKFKLDINKINAKYNENYLQAEYQFAVSSVQMAEKWQNFQESDRYHLQYRTAQDDKVRVSHQPLHGITLPTNHIFWDEFYPPNGWRCRCNAVQVRASKYPATNEEYAISAGDKALTQIDKNGKNKLAIFRMNAGKERIIFPKDHPYTKIKDSSKVKSQVLKNYE